MRDHTSSTAATKQACIVPEESSVRQDGPKTRQAPRAVRQPFKLIADPKRVLARIFVPGGEERARAIINRVLSLSKAQVTRMLHAVQKDFASRHRDITAVFSAHYEEVARLIEAPKVLTADQCLLIGAYFTSEYSLESVALFNPSMVLHPDQAHLGDGESRFVMSLRACGEGHISSIEFRTGVIDAMNQVRLDAAPRFAGSEKPIADKQYEKYPFFLKLIEMGAYNEIGEAILADVGEFFTLEQLHRVVLNHHNGHADPEYFEETTDNILWLARSNYHLRFPRLTELTERVIFPVNENESRGIEDARFVRFTYKGGQVVYYATCTAYNGFRILPQLIETSDFRYFKIITLNGRYAQNKGMALFPRLIDGNYMMVSRVDGENLFLMESENLHFWNKAKELRQPLYPWEFMQIGNCGSPLETERGWLLLTHGVGPMRQYCIGAVLLDLQDPSKVIGHTRHPILMPSAEERDGYVPNVVYSCGAVMHNGEIVIPYAMADTATGIATIETDALLDHMTR